MISIRGLVKRYGEKLAVDHLDLDIPGGELFAFLGPNGAGKTTTIKILTGLLRPTAGKVTVCDFDVEKEYLEAKSRISYIPEQPYLYDKLTGREFLEFVGRLYQMRAEDIQKEVNRFDDLFQFEDYIHELCESYSHGMKQKIVIASAFMHHPEVVVIDEPMVGLDPRSARLVKDLLRSEADAGTTIFMSTHTLSVAEQVADRIGIIHKGKLLTIGTLADLRGRSRTDADLEGIFLKITEEE